MLYPLFVTLIFKNIYIGTRKANKGKLRKRFVISSKKIWRNCLFPLNANVYDY